MLKAFKFKIYPNKEQQVLIEKHIGCARFIYNWGLAKKIEHYQQNKEKLSCFTLIKEITILKNKKILNG